MSVEPTVLVLALLSCAPAVAQSLGIAGFSGEVSLSSGYTSSTSNFNTDDDAIIRNNNQKAQSTSNYLLLPLGSVAFTFGQGRDKQIYAGTSREDITIGSLALELGFKQQLTSGAVLDISYLPTIMSGETWADPFLVGSPRYTTDEQGYAYRFKLSNIAGSGFTLDSAIAEQEIDDERSGLDSGYNTHILNRNADKLYIKGSFRLFLNRAFFVIPAIVYIYSNADGEANSNRSVGGELSLFQRYDRHQLALTINYTDRSYEAVHPVYNLVRDETDLGFFAAYEYRQFFGWRNLSFVSFVGYGQTDSNIQFYNNKQLILSSGVNFKF